jgi:hypothetical protein
MKPGKPTHKAKRIRRIALIVLLVLVAGFVAYNLYASRDIETVEQSTVATVDDTPATPTSETPVEGPTEPIVRSGSFESLNGYTVSGEVQLIVDGNERQLVFSDSFASSVGPDVLVYLSKNDTANEGGVLREPISLGPIQGFNGTQTYTLPANSDDYDSVVIWCRAFSSAFGSASV